MPLKDLLYRQIQIYIISIAYIDWPGVWRGVDRRRIRAGVSRAEHPSLPSLPSHEQTNRHCPPRDDRDDASNQLF